MDNKRHGGTIDISTDDVDAEATDSSPSDDATSSPDSKSSTERLSSAPEPPRWRFVNEAKKSLGYSSFHAGSFIQGKSSEELGAKYVAPDISLYQHKKEEVQPNKVSFSLHSNDSLHKDGVEVGKLDANVPPNNAFVNGNNEVGRLSIREAGASETALPSGEFAGLPKPGSQSAPPRNPFKQWGVNYPVGPKQGREHEWYDGEVRDSYKMPGGEGYDKTIGKAGRLSFHGQGSGDESFAGEVPRSSRDGNNGQEGDAASVDSNGNPREGALFIHRNGSTDGKKEVDSSMTNQQSGEVSKKKKYRWLYLLLLLLLALIVILGVLMGTRKEEEQVAAASVGGIILPPVLVLDNSTSVPSSNPSESLSPTVAPTTECPMDMKAFSIMHLAQGDNSQAATTSDSTWRIKDACSGEIVSRCLPCSLASYFQPDPDSEDSSVLESNEPTRRRSEGDRLGNTTECLPADKEYVLEIIPADEAAPCCGFNPVTSIISYDNVVVSYGASSESRLDSMYFGEKETPCASETPSISPTVEDTVAPTTRPTTRPTPQPTCSTEQEFNLCLAVDMSGSVCNDGSGSECSDCQTSSSSLFSTFLPSFFGYSDCRDSFIDEDSCCKNFADVKEFSGMMVQLLGDFPADQSFSVVQFSTTAKVVSNLASVEQTVQVVNSFDYTGGLTNHASAIQMCQQTLAASPSSDRKDFIMLVTDGVSSEPGLDPQGAAEQAASAAQVDGTVIIPVFISPNGNDPSALAFMRRLSSDGKVFDVTDFESLASLQDGLVDQVSCS